MMINHFFSRYKFTLITAAVVMWLTLAPLGSNSMAMSRFAPWPNFDKTVHMGMFGLLTCAWLTDIWKGRSTRKNLLLLSALVIAIISTLCGGGIELAQDAMKLGRGAEWGDFIADAIGSFAAAIVWLLGRTSAKSTRL